MRARVALSSIFPRRPQPVQCRPPPRSRPPLRARRFRRRLQNDLGRRLAVRRPIPVPRYPTAAPRAKFGPESRGRRAAVPADRSRPTPTRFRTKTPARPVPLRGAPAKTRGPLAYKCRKCYLGAGAHVRRHQGTSRQNMGNKCYMLRHVPAAVANGFACETKQLCHWHRDCRSRQAA